MENKSPVAYVQWDRIISLRCRLPSTVTNLIASNFELRLGALADQRYQIDPMFIYQIVAKV